MTKRNVAIRPTQTQLIVDIDDLTLLKDIKKAIGLIRGVKTVKLPRRKKLSAYEEALQDEKEGRVCEYESVDDFFTKMGL